MSGRRGGTTGGGRDDRGWRWGAFVIAAAIVALAAWAWWIPNGVFLPWIARARALLHR